MFVFFALFAAALAPVLWFGLPMAMADYPNHLARMFILSRSGGPHPNPFYEIAWGPYPNLAMDLLVPPLGRLIGVVMATRFFYLGSQILIVTGAMALERVIKGRIAIAGFAALIFIYSLPFAWGFVNFEFAIGCALWGIAGAVHWQNRGWIVRLLLHSAVIPLLFLAHMFALGVYGFVIGVHELWRARSHHSAVFELVGRLAVMALPSLALLVLFARGDSNVGTGTHWAFSLKPIFILHILNGYSLLASASAVVTLILMTIILARRGALCWVQSGAWLAISFALLYLVMPFRLFNGTFVDLRVIVAAGLILPAFTSVSFPKPAWRRGALAVAAAITILNVAVVAKVWFSYRTDYTAAAESFRLLPKHAMVLVGSERNEDPPRDLTDFPAYHIPTLAVQYADAFVSDLFMEPGKQPIIARAPWRRFNVANVGPVPMTYLKKIAERGGTDSAPAFIRTWPKDFGYLYIVGTPRANPMPTLLQEILKAPHFVLYRIRKGALAGGTSQSPAREQDGRANPAIQDQRP